MSKRTDWIEQNKTSDGVKLGMVSPTVMMDYVRFTTFMDYLPNSKSRRQAMEKAAKYLTTTRTTILKAVTFFEDGK